MEQSIFETLHYFARFQYPPTYADVHRYMPVLISEFALQQELARLQAAGALHIEQERIFLLDRNYEGFFVRKQASEELLQYARSYLTNLEYIPTIELIGISGSMSMANGNSLDDIDLFIITRSNAIWLTRFLVLIYKRLLMLVNYKIASKLCFNLFFSENGLKIPKEKQNLYVGHELLQLKVIYNKSGTYNRLLTENSWVNDLLPNARIRFETITSIDSKNQKSIYYIEKVLGTIQKWWLRARRYTYREQDGQLWLIQKDWSMEE
ncbi:hypothetical protein KAZ66_04145 [Candidatus Woesebacteria bacterium]|nr:hypothetical protein [Candidatus Woesebacteria bacterium]